MEKDIGDETPPIKPLLRLRNPLRMVVRIPPLAQETANPLNERWRLILSPPDRRTLVRPSNGISRSWMRAKRGERKSQITLLRCRLIRLLVLFG